MEENEIIYDNVAVVEAQDDVTTEEVIRVVEVDEAEGYDVEMAEAFPATSDNPAYNHALLNNREIPDAHPISAITGLRAELDSIEALQTIYSDKKGIADYYEWADASYDEVGYFVSWVPNTSTIKICDGADILGVSVDNAGFVGNQSDEPRTNKYGLIMTSGLAEVRCEVDVEVGDHVVSNAYGYAKKTTCNYGYKVLAKEQKDGVDYVVILLGVQADAVHNLGENLDEVKEALDAHDKNIVSAINMANQAYNKSAESATVSEEAIIKALEAMQKAEDAVDTADKMEEILASTSATSAQAKAIAEGAVTSAMTLRDEAMSRANDAWAKADTVQTEVYSLCAEVDKYSVGEYSQAYGLTLEQAQSILEIGLIYVPTKHIDTVTHKEEYAYEKDGVAQAYEREFTPGYLYQWDYIANSDIEIGWLTVGEAPSVYFTTMEPVASTSYRYWYTDGDVITDIEGNTDTFESYTLYRWEGDHWLAVATLKGNVNNRAVSEIYQTTNEIMLGVTNPHGCIAAMDARLTDTESKLDLTAQWAKGDDGSGKPSYNLAAVELSSDEDGSSLALVVADESGNTVLGGASIVLSQDTNSSFISLDADRIDFKGGEIKFDATNINFDVENYTIDADKINLNGETILTTDEDDGETRINGANIATGTITANQIAAGAITADQIAADAITAEKIDVEDLGACAAAIGGWQIGEDGIYKDSTKLISNNNVVAPSLFSEGEFSPIRLDIGGHIATHEVVLDAVSDGGEFTYVYYAPYPILTAEIVSYVDDMGDEDQFDITLEINDDELTINGRNKYGPFDGVVTLTVEYTVEKSNFRVLDDGSLYASAAKIEGEIMASGGEIGGFTIGASALYKGSTYLYADDGIMAPSLVTQDALSPIRLAIGNHGQLKIQDVVFDDVYSNNGYINYTTSFDRELVDVEIVGYMGPGEHSYTYTMSATINNDGYGIAISGECVDGPTTGMVKVTVRCTYKAPANFEVLDDGSLYAAAVQIDGVGQNNHISMAHNSSDDVYNYCATLTSDAITTKRTQNDTDKQIRAILNYDQLDFYDSSTPTGYSWIRHNGNNELGINSSSILSLGAPTLNVNAATLTVNGSTAPTGWVEINSNCYLYFVNGIFMKWSRTTPSNYIDNAISPAE